MNKEMSLKLPKNQEISPELSNNLLLSKVKNAKVPKKDPKKKACPKKKKSKPQKQQEEEEKEEKKEAKEENNSNTDNISVDGSIDLANISKKNVFLARTVSIKRSSSLKNKPLFPEETTKSTILKHLNEETNVLSINLDHNTYKFDLKNPIIASYFSFDKNLNEILTRFDEFKSIYNEKQMHKIPEICKITDHCYYTCLDCFFEHVNLLIQAKIKANDLTNKLNSPDESELDRCCICQCDLYESILKYSTDQIIENLSSKDPNQEEVIKLDKCEGHYFHKTCFLSFLQEKTFIKCPICSLIYGVMIGDQPDGKMTYSINKYSKCEGFEEFDTICIEYNMRGVEKDNVKYSPTHRIAYLPNNPEGREVLNLLKTAFERRLIFTLGTSVTTGRTNQIVWNGIHHKTGLYGGSAYFGYPDKTYFNRVKLELAAKGVY